MGAAPLEDADSGLPPARAVESPVAGSVWKILTEETGKAVEAGDTLAVLESMKMEIRLDAPVSGTLCACLCKEAQPVQPGQALFAISPAQ